MRINKRKVLLKARDLIADGMHEHMCFAVHQAITTLYPDEALYARRRARALLSPLMPKGPQMSDSWASHTNKSYARARRVRALTALAYGKRPAIEAMRAEFDRVRYLNYVP